MCGINGIISEASHIKRNIYAMNKLIRHRGPDDEGYVLINSKDKSYRNCAGEDTIAELKNKLPHISRESYDNFNIIFGTRRLSIIDLSKNGHQPMSDSSGTIWITYNGEIYNYIELREELLQDGFKFKTRSDTEVIIYSYLKWGTECLNRFNGMWAFALWDGYKKRVLLARDRFGVKPLYYTSSGNYFAFSSEIKPLVFLNGNDFAVNENKISFFIVFGNRLNQSETYIKNIYSLNASSYLIYENREFSIQKYYDVEDKQMPKRTENELARELNEILYDSIRLRFRSDVPVGTCLSGGFDSSSIVAISSEISKERLNTFSAVWGGNENAKYDESKYIDIVNKAFNCLENKIEPKADEFEKEFDRINYFQEIPTDGPGLIPQWNVMKKAGKKVKVVLDGQGGDEVFGGYFSARWHLSALFKDKHFLLLLSELKLLSKFFSKKEAHALSIWLFPGFYNKIVRRFFSEQYKILNGDLRRNIKRADLYYDAEPVKKFRSYLSSLSNHFIRQLSIPTLLHYEDRSSMAHSIESRVPFLDYRLVEFGVNLPAKYLVDKHVSRPLFRNAVKDRLPDEILKRRVKLGFPAPFTEWTRGPLKEFVSDSFMSANLFNGLVDRTFVEQHLKKHFESKIDFSWDIWRLLTLEKFLSLPLQIKKNLTL